MTTPFASAKDAFPRSVREYYANEPEAPLKRRRAAMDSAWDVFKEAQAFHDKHQASVGFNPDTSNEGLLKLNVGGVHVNIPRALLQDAERIKKTTLGTFLGGTWNRRLPLDGDGRIVLDASPQCGEVIIHTLLQRAGRTRVSALTMAQASRLQQSADTVQYSLRASTVFEPQTNLEYDMNIVEGSTVLGSDELSSASWYIRSWAPGYLNTMELTYRGSRDRMAYTSALSPSLWGNGSTPNIILLRVPHNSGVQDSVVGCFSGFVPQTTTAAQRPPLPDSFIFILKDGMVGGRDFQPERWFLREEEDCPPTTLTNGSLAIVEGGDLNLINLPQTRGNASANKTFRRILHIGKTHFDIPDDSQILNLSGLEVSEMEVFRVFAEPTVPRAKRRTATVNSAQPSKDQVDADVCNFGTSIARALLEEVVGLEYARTGLKKEIAGTSAAVKALEIVYGPKVAAGEEDAVVDLNVRGTRMTTLRSTLRACPTSALAARFDEGKWPANGEDADKNHRPFIDCKPSSFSKILDVLRTRKREGWASSKKSRQGKTSHRTYPRLEIVDEEDLESFDEFVDMHFPGCETFITDLVKPS